MAASVLVASWFVVQRLVPMVGGSTTVVLAAATAAIAAVDAAVADAVVVAGTAHFSRQIVPSLQCVANDSSDVVFDGCGVGAGKRKRCNSVRSMSDC